MCIYLGLQDIIHGYKVERLKIIHLHHGLVSTEGQQHAGAQLVLSQREEELLGLIAGAHQDMNLEEEEQEVGHVTVQHDCVDAYVCACVFIHSPYWQRALRRHRRPRLLDCRAGTSHLSLNAR